MGQLRVTLNILGGAERVTVTLRDSLHLIHQLQQQTDLKLAVGVLRAHQHQPVALRLQPPDLSVEVAALGTRPVS